MTRRTLALALLLVGSSIAAPSEAPVIRPVEPSASAAATLGGVGQELRSAPHGAEAPSLPLVASAIPERIGSIAASQAGAISTALIGGWATYWATCAECAAAGPLLRAALGPDWQGTWITVESRHGKALLRLVTSCACGDRRGTPTVIDVSREAFDELSPYAAGSDQDPGIVAVSIEIPSLSTTDAAPDDRMRLEVRGDDLYEEATR